jgi:hypothetical protein
MNTRVHTTNPRYAKRLWQELGGIIKPVRGTGELRYLHPAFPDSIRANDRRSDVPAVLLCRINKLLVRSPVAHTVMK